MKLTPYELVRNHLRSHICTRKQLSEAIGLKRTCIANCILDLRLLNDPCIANLRATQKRAYLDPDEIPDKPWPKPDADRIVASAMAQRHPLEMAWS